VTDRDLPQSFSYFGIHLEDYAGGVRKKAILFVQIGDFGDSGELRADFIFDGAQILDLMVDTIFKMAAYEHHHYLGKGVLIFFQVLELLLDILSPILGFCILY